jgi:RNA polymerase sigma factor (sigma-70 family)
MNDMYEQNRWWKGAAARMVAGKANGQDWDDADRSLRCLLRSLNEAQGLRHHDREDAVQEVLTQLQDGKLVRRLDEIDTPAHYLATVLRNRLRADWATERRDRRAHKEAAEGECCDDERPDRIVEKAELLSKADYIIHHEVSAEDRKILWGYYRDGKTAAVLALELGITHMAALQRLARARARLRDYFK